MANVNNVTILLNNNHTIHMRYKVLQVYTNRWSAVKAKIDDPNDTVFVSPMIISMTKFDAAQVQNVVKWMHREDIVVNVSNLSHLFFIAQYMDIPSLMKWLTYIIQDDQDLSIALLNNLSELYMDAPRPRRDFLCHLVLLRPSNYVLDFVINAFSYHAPNLSRTQVNEIPFKSIIAMMASFVDLRAKVPLIFLVMDWIQIQRPSKNTVYEILQSFYLRDAELTAMEYSIRYNMYSYLTKRNGTTKFRIHHNGISEFSSKPNDETNSIDPALLVYRQFDDPSDPVTTRDMISTVRHPRIFKARDFTRRRLPYRHRENARPPRDPRDPLIWRYVERRNQPVDYVESPIGFQNLPRPPWESPEMLTIRGSFEILRTLDYAPLNRATYSYITEGKLGPHFFTTPGNAPFGVWATDDGERNEEEVQNVSRLIDRFRF